MIATDVGNTDFGVFTGQACPQRLCQATRDLAARALSGEFGQGLKKNSLRLEPGETEGVSAEMQAALGVRRTAEFAPLRIRPEELLVGSASMREGLAHNIPFTGIGAVSHLTLDFARILEIGYAGLQQQLDERRERGGLDEEGRDLLEAMQICLDAARLWHGRYVHELEELICRTAGKERRNYRRILESLRPVPEQRPQNFREAIQSLWMLWCLHRLCGTWSGIGRIDKMLGPYLAADLESGAITLEEARELIAHFWIKGCEWILGDEHKRGSGDAQVYQNIVLGGIDAKGNSVVNEVTYLVLEVVEELHISDFPISVRLNSQTPEKLFRKIAQVDRRGGGIIAVYNEEVVIEGLLKFGYPLEEAREFANDGCWEVIIPGKTAFSYRPFDMLFLVQEAIGLNGDDASAVPPVENFEELYALFLEKLRWRLDEYHAQIDSAFDVEGWGTPLTSLFLQGCIEKGRGYKRRGAKYNVVAPHASGLPDAANSLQAIKKLVYEECCLSLEEFVEILRSDWKGHEAFQREVGKRVRLYGNGDSEADAMLARVYDDYTAIAAETPERNGVLRPAGISTFGRELSLFKKDRRATAFGRNEDDILASNLSPSPGTDLLGPTAVLRSYCLLDFTKLPNGAPLDLKLLPESLKGEDGLQALVGLLKTFVRLRGMFMHIDVVDDELLKKAQKQPEKYPNLSVRVSGWSARFATLDREWQEMIINRTQHSLN